MIRHPLVATLGIFIAFCTLGGVVHAHAGLGAAGPAPGSVVGGDITEIQLRYNRTVADVEGSVIDPDGEPVGSTWTQDGNLRVVVTLVAPLTAPGEYEVRHTSTDVEDDDRVDASYTFTFDPDAPPPQLELIPDDEGFPWVLVVILIGLVIIGELVRRLIVSIKRQRPEQPSTAG